MNRLTLVIVVAVLSCAPQLATPALAQSESLSDVFDRVSGAVVVVRTRQKEMASSPDGKAVSMTGLGSGVLISADGKILTAAHVVQTADEIRVEFPGGAVIRATVTASAPIADVALLQLAEPPPSAAVAKLGDSGQTRVGEQVFVVGAPFGIDHTLTVGHISARRSPKNVEGLLGQAELFQTDAAINQGNSGGPMFNLKGEVIGVVSHIITRSGGFQGLGFAVTSNTAKAMLMDRAAFWSGMEGYLLGGDLARIFNVPQEAGILVQRIAASSPAEKAGLRAGVYRATIEGEELLLGGDIVLSAMGIEVGASGDFDRIYRLLASLRPGETAKITILRDGERKTLEIPVP